MSEVPQDLKYADSHEWARAEDDVVRVGISDHAQSQLGDLVYIELPEADSEVEAGDACAVVESVKAASDVYSPVSGKVVEVNEDLADSPELVNQSPYEDGWLFTVSVAGEADLSQLMTAEAYGQFLEDAE